MGGSTTKQSGGALQQASIVALLVGAEIFLHSLYEDDGQAFDPTAMLALGFVVLASHTIGKLVEVIKLPHITGYLLAGVVFGASGAALLPDILRVAPFDRGILNPQIVEQLRIFDTAAVALIALSAGGELQLESLKKGLRTILGVLLGQYAAIIVVIGALIFALSGVIPAIQLPGFSLGEPIHAVAFAAMVAAISFATSPAATIAVMTDCGAKGPMSRTVLSSVVLKDVLVVISFAIASLWAAGLMGLGAGQQSIGNALAQHIGGSIAVGGLLGLVLALYLRYIHRETLLFLLGLIYTASYTSEALHLDPVLLFLAAGFTVANFSKEGHTLIESVNRLSMPIYVVFFTLAGAGLHLDHVVHVAPFAVALVVLRAGAIFVGVRAGAVLTDGDDNLRRYGWLGFVSQAGVAISLASVVGKRFGEAGAAIETLLIAGVALNELAGPVLLKLGITLAGEAGGSSSTEEGKRPSILPSMRAPVPEGDLWGGAIQSATPALSELLEDLRADLQLSHSHGIESHFKQLRQESDLFQRELRREFLRAHRRLSVGLRDVAQRDSLVRTEQAELAERFRGIVLARAATVKQLDFTPIPILERVALVVDGLPRRVMAHYEPSSFLARADEGLWLRTRRLGLRARRRLNRVFGLSMPPRALPLRMLARYHLYGQLPARLEGFAVLLIRLDKELSRRSRSLFETILQHYASLADCPAEERALQAKLARIRDDVETEFRLAAREQTTLLKDAARRLEQAFADGFKRVWRESLVLATPELAPAARRTSRLFRQRNRAIEALSTELTALRQASAAGYTLHGLELEFIAFEIRLQEAVEVQLETLTKSVRGRSQLQAGRVQEALITGIEELRPLLDDDTRGTTEALSEGLKLSWEPVARIVGEAARAAQQLVDQLADDRTIAPLLETLVRDSRALAERYEIIERPLEMSEWRLPTVPALTEVPFNQLVSTYVDTSIAPKLVQVIRNLAANIGPYAAALVELERRVSLNTELALGELEFAANEEVSQETLALAREIVLGAMERGLGTIESYQESAAEWAEQLSAQMTQTVFEGLQTLREELVCGQLSPQRVQSLRRAAAGRRLLRHAEALPWRFSQARDQAAELLRRTVGDERINYWRAYLGLRARSATPTLDARTFEAPHIDHNLPLVYRRLFAVDTLEAGETLTGRQEELERACRALRERRASTRAVAIVGLDGVGKSSLSNAILRKSGFKQIRRLNFTAPVTLEEVQALFTQKSEGSVIVIDGFHWLFAMRPGGLAPLRTFIDGIIADRGQRAWLMHANALSWAYAVQLAPLEAAFPETIHLPPLSREQLESAVLARHALSGYGLAFDQAPTEQSALQRRVQGMTTRLRRPYQVFFRSLHAASGGLMRDALRLWLASVEQLDEGQDFVRVSMVPASPLPYVRALPESWLLEVFQVARQGWMDVATFGYLFRRDTTEAQADLARLRHFGLLEEQRGIYQVTAHLRGVLTRVFNEKGWVNL